MPGLSLALCSRWRPARLAQVVFIGVNVLNPTTYLAVALVECAIVLVACIGPALRAPDASIRCRAAIRMMRSARVLLR